MNVELFVLNYNGADCTPRCVESLKRAVGFSKNKCCLTVIDNDSQDDSVKILNQKYPEVPILRMPNRSLSSFNDAVKQSRSEIVFLLNNDLEFAENFIDPMVFLFEKEKGVFSVSAKSYLMDKIYEGGLSVPCMKWGMFSTRTTFSGYETLINSRHRTFAAGFGAFDREKFLALHGYDDLYLPGRMEDADLFFRAWKKGWKSYYQPESHIFHIGGKSFKAKFGERGTMELAHRNTFLFMWKNMRDWRYWLFHVFFLIPRILWMLITGRYEFVTGFFKALFKLNPVRLSRNCENKIQYLYSDRQVIEGFGNGS